MIKIALDKGKKSSASYSTAVDADRYAIKAYSNFLGNDNEELAYDEILRPFWEGTIPKFHAILFSENWSGKPFH